jgi:hypothetical protein
MPGRIEWVLLAYRLPREPSTPRITVWRRLRRLGAAQLADGLVALPRDARTKEQLEWIASEVVEAGGRSTLWLGRVGTARAERELIAQMADEIAAEYESVSSAAAAARAEDGPNHYRAAARLRRELHRIAQRDYFPTPSRDRAHRAVDLLAEQSLVTA